MYIVTTVHCKFNNIFEVKVIAQTMSKNWSRIVYTLHTFNQIPVPTANLDILRFLAI